MIKYTLQHVSDCNHAWVSPEIKKAGGWLFLANEDIGKENFEYSMYFEEDNLLSLLADKMDGFIFDATKAFKKRKLNG